MYPLALCADPASLPKKEIPEDEFFPPIVKPLFKYVVRPGDTVSKPVIVQDLHGRELTVRVEGLPEDARYDAATRRIEWKPGAAEEGVHLIRVTASNDKLETTRPFVIIVKPDAGKGPVPRRPGSLGVRLAEGGRAVRLSWASAGKDARVYLIYRDGILWAAAPGGVTSWTDRERLRPGQNCRYHVSVVAANGGESPATQASPPILHIPIEQ